MISSTNNSFIQTIAKSLLCARKSSKYYGYHSEHTVPALNISTYWWGRQTVKKTTKQAYNQIYNQMSSNDSYYEKKIKLGVGIESDALKGLI